MSFNESIGVELEFGRKKIFITVLYQSPAFDHTSPEFQDFKSNIENLYLNIKAESDFDAHSQFSRPNGDTTPKGVKIDELFTNLGLSQVISEPTNFEPHKNLIVTDQSNIILESGIRASLDSYFHHQIIHCKVNFRIPPPLPFERNF